jgi:hypothetical protein
MEAESEVEFPAAAFCQVKSFPDGILQIGFRDGNLPAYCFNGCPIPGGVLGFVGFAFGIHGVSFISAVWVLVVHLEKMLRNKCVSSMG